MHLQQTQLPILKALDDIKHALNQRDELVLEAEPGAGKTTIIPLALLDQDWLTGKQIIMLEPRRMAARAAAERMAKLLEEPVGETVGYRIRNEHKSSKRTRIHVVTEGILTRWLQNDPELKNVGAVIFDEFHERNLNSDLGLALCLQSRDVFRESHSPLKLILMSATMDTVRVASFLRDAPIVSSAGRSFPIKVYFDGARKRPGPLKTKSIPTTRELIEHCSRKILELSPKSQHNMLVFLPGKNEIQRLLNHLKQTLPSEIDVLPLHGSLTQQEQQRAITPNTTGNRKIVLTTDIAETSLTIDGISIVIDTGLARTPVFDPRTGVTRLTTRRISMDSAEQRAGRAGRVSAGECHRLWSESTHQELDAQRRPEIHQADLAPLALQLLQWGVSSIDELDFLDPPNQGAFDQALELLDSLGATKSEAPSNTQQPQNSLRSLSTHGSEMSRLSTHPRFAHMLIQSQNIGANQEASLLSAILSERDPFRDLGGDINARLHIALGLQPCPPAQKLWLRQVKQQAATLSRALNTNTPKSLVVSSNDTPGYLLALAFPDRIAKKRAHNSEHCSYTLSNGRSATLFASDALSNEEYLSVADVGGIHGHTEDRIYLAAPLNPKLIKEHLSHLLRSELVLEWDPTSGKFSAEQHRYLGKLLIDKQAQNIGDKQRQEALLNYVKKEQLNGLNWDNRCRQLQARVQLINKHEGALNLPSFDNKDLAATAQLWLSPYLTHVKSLQELAKIPLFDALTTQLTWPQRTALDRLAPEKTTVASGSKVTIDYLHLNPNISVKLQEMFGCDDNPTILNGTVRLSVTLLSPAKRPLQITQNLASFWQNAYSDVKKEMKGRYPKHPWPDDPLTASATAFTKKRLQKDH